MIKLSAIGDVALFGDYDDLIIKKGHDFPFANVNKHFNNSDVIFANLEAPLSNQGKPKFTKPISLRGSTSGIDSLIHAGITHVSLANNHAYDYGKKAIRDTQTRLKKAGIPFVGIGKNLRDARSPIIENIQGETLAMLAYNSFTTNGRNYATKTKDGVAPLEYKYIKSDIDLIKNKYENCFILVSLHWGVEGTNYPTPFQRSLGHQIIEDGANLIIGHHPHVMQGIERHRDGIIIYSLGNFCFPNYSSPTIEGIGYKQNPENQVSFIFQCEILGDCIGAYNTIPIYLNDNLQPEIASGEHKLNILEKINHYSKPLCNKNYKQFYKSEKIHEKGYFSRLNGLLKRQGIIGILKRIRLGYLLALIIAFRNSLNEKRNKRQVFQGISK